MFGIKFADAFLWLNWQNCPFNDALWVEKVKPGSHMPLTYLGHGRRHGMGQRCGICEQLSPTHR